MIIKKLKIYTAILIGALFLVGCDVNWLAAVKAGFSAFDPFVASLVQSGTWTQEKADAAKKDINDGIDVAERGDICVKAIPADYSKAQKQIGKAKCYLAAVQESRVILARRHLTGGAKLDQMLIILDGTLTALQVYAAAVIPKPTPAMRGATPPTPVFNENAEQELERALKEQKKKIDALKP